MNIVQSWTVFSNKLNINRYPLVFIVLVQQYLKHEHVFCSLWLYKSKIPTITTPKTHIVFFLCLETLKGNDVFDIYIYIDVDWKKPCPLTRRHEAVKSYRRQSSESEGIFSVFCAAPHSWWSALLSKETSRDLKTAQNIIKYYLPKAQLHALHNKQHKKSQDFILFCLFSFFVLPRNSVKDRTCDFVCFVCVCERERELVLRLL